MRGRGWVAGIAGFAEAALLALLALAMVAIILLNFANVVGRYLLSAPIPAADEIMTFTMVWGVFLGCGIVTLRGAHLNMDLLLGLLSPRARRVAEAASALLALPLLGFVAYQSIDYLETIGAIGLTSMAAGIPMALVHLAIPIGFGLMMLAALARLALPRP
jgi:TRAP-type C4-dicarboxylate transport system permease small subunit